MVGTRARRAPIEAPIEATTEVSTPTVSFVDSRMEETYVSDSPVQKPVGCRGHGERFCADLEGENFPCHNPCTRAPATSKEEDIHTNPGYKGLLGRAVGDRLTSAYTSDDCKLRQGNFSKFGVKATY